MSINIFIDKVNGRTVVNASGEERKPLTHEDYSLFEIDQERIKTHLQNGWGGGRPKAIYFDNNGLPWGDQSYEKHGLTSCYLRRRVRNAHVVQDVVRPYAATGVMAYNNSPYNSKVHVDTNFMLANKVVSSWSADARISDTTTVSAEIGGEAVGGKVSVSKSLTVEAGYGQGGSKEKDEQIGSGTSVEVELPAFSAAQAHLASSRGILVVRVEYETTVHGHLWIDYGRRVKLVGRSNPRGNGHFFYFDAIEWHVPRPVKTAYQTLEYDLYTENSVTIKQIPMKEQGMG